MKNLLRVGAVAALSAFGDVAEAALLTVGNAGFETQTVNDGEYIDNGAPTSWTAYDPFNIIGINYNSLGVLNPTGTALYPGGAPQGSKVALVFLWPQNMAQFNRPAGIQQTLGSTLQANTAYTLTVRVGNIAVDPDDSVAFNLNGFPGYQVQLLAGSTILWQDNNTLAPAEGQFLLSTVQYTAAVSDPLLGQALTIRLINLGAVNSGIEVNFDDVKLDATAVPEPSTYALTGLGALLVLGQVARRRSQNRARRSACLLV